MINKFLHGIGAILFFLISTEVVFADRITLLAGDIFIGKIQDINNNRYTINRFGIRDIMPRWTVKKIERDVDILPPLSAESVQSETQFFQLAGRSITVRSVTPAETSHLELYPKREHFWVEPEQYLRGYLVNHSKNAYSRLEVCFQFKDIKRMEIGRIATEIYEVYPQTMKPFIIKTNWVEWSKVQKINVEIIGRVPLKRPDT